MANKLPTAIGILQDWTADLKAYNEQLAAPELHRVADMMGAVLVNLRIVNEDIENYKRNVQK